MRTIANEIPKRHSRKASKEAKKIRLPQPDFKRFDKLAKLLTIRINSMKWSDNY